MYATIEYMVERDKYKFFLRNTTESTREHLIIFNKATDNFIPEQCFESK